MLSIRCQLRWVADGSKTTRPVGANVARKPLSVFILASAVILIALASIAWSLWVRRITWTSRWESAATLSVALQGLGLILVTPVGTATVGRALHRIMGQKNLEFPVGHTCLILAAAALVYSVLDRIYDDDEELRESFKQWVERPITLTIMGLLAVFSIGGIGAAVAMHGQRPGMWMNVYWALLCGTLIYLLTYACRALLILRKDWRQRRVADLYLAACASGVLACASRMITTLIPPVQERTLVNIAVGVLGCMWLGGFALASSYSWRQKNRPFERLGEAVAG